MERIWITDDERLITLARGAVGGAIAGAVFAAAETIAAAIGGYDLSLPFRTAASVLFGRAAFGMSLPLTLFVGLLIHFAVSTAYGMFAAMLSEWSESLRSLHLGLGAFALLGVWFGGFVWLVNMATVGQALYPWIWSWSQPMQLVLHMMFFGAPLGIALPSLERAWGERQPASF